MESEALDIEFSKIILLIYFAQKLWINMSKNKDKLDTLVQYFLLIWHSYHSILIPLGPGHYKNLRNDSFVKNISWAKFLFNSVN